MKPFRAAHSLIPFVFSLFMLLIPGPATAVDLTVEENTTDPSRYATIQSAIDYASFYLASNPTTTLKFTVRVLPGTYTGGIVLKNNIPVLGREIMRTFVNGGPSGVAMTANNVTGVTVQNLTFLNAQTGIAVSNASTITITNNVFVGLSGTAIQISGASSNFITNNTFYNNAVAVSRASENVFITNNIFSRNQTNISQLSTISANNITYNDFHPAPALGTVTGSNYLPDTTNPDSDPLFVAPTAALRDFHLTAGSPCIDRGDPGKFDPYSIFNSSTSTTPATNPSDIGAYGGGGAEADTIPAPVSGITSTATTATPYAIRVDWKASTNYLVGGYRVHYGPASMTYTGTDAQDSAGNSIPSPVDVGAATSLTLNSLATATFTPESPVLSPPQPRNSALVVSWSSVTGATSYTVHWGIASPSDYSKTVLGDTSTTIAPLTNGQIYKIAVTATAQSVYYIAVTAYDQSGMSLSPGVSHESALVKDYEVYSMVGPEYVSGLSNEVNGLPELLAPYPDLPNTGCFIATAAYGSADAAPVMILRTFRDRFLLATPGGRTFVRWYYAISPRISAFLNDHPALKPLVRGLLAPLVLAAAIANLSPALLGLLLIFCCFGIALLLRRYHPGIPS